jgi:hypothetical protein
MCSMSAIVLSWLMCFTCPSDNLHAVLPMLTCVLKKSSGMAEAHVCFPWWLLLQAGWSPGAVAVQ